MIHWTRLRGNVYLFKPNPKMAIIGDDVPIKNARLKGESDSDKKTRTVHFDKEFVLAYIRYFLFVPLNIQSPENLTWLKGLIDEAFNGEEEVSTEG
jgi:hypothetical protein